MSQMVIIGDFNAWGKKESQMSNYKLVPVNLIVYFVNRILLFCKHSWSPIIVGFNSVVHVLV